MKKEIFLFIFLLPFVLQAQKPFLIKGYGKGFNEGDKIFMLYREFGVEQSVADSTLVKNGAFEFAGNIKNITTGGIYRNTNPMYANTIRDQFTIYLEPGTIVLNSVDTLRNSRVSGTPSNNDLMELVIALKSISNDMSRLSEVDELSETDKKNPKVVEALVKQWQDLGQLMPPIQFDFIKKHPNSYVSLVTLNSLSTDAKLLTKVEEVFPLLNENLRAMPMAKNILRRMEFARKMNVGMVAKNFAQRDVNGKEIKLSDYLGKYVLVDFWASWCLPCRAENPNVIAAYQKYHTKGLEILGVSLDDEKGKSAWLKAIKDDGLKWQQVSDLKGWSNEAAVLYGVTSIPSNFLIDPNGKVIAKNLKGEVLSAFLKNLFKE